VLFAAPDQLDRVAELAGDVYRLKDEVRLQTTAKPATDELVVDNHFFHWHAADFGGTHLRKTWGLAANPQLAHVRAHVRHAGHRLQWRVRQERLLINRFEMARRVFQRGGDVAGLLGEHAI